MSDPICPDCNHYVSKHGDFFCMTVDCRCNQGREAVLAKYKLELAKQALNEIILYSQWDREREIAETALKEINNA